MILGERGGSPAVPDARRDEVMTKGRVLQRQTPPVSKPSSTSTTSSRSAQEWRTWERQKQAAVSRPPAPTGESPYMPTGLHAALRDQGWTTPKVPQAKGLPDSMFSGESNRLAEHNYTLNPDEMDFLKKFVSSPEGAVAGYKSPVDYIAAEGEPYWPGKASDRVPLVKSSPETRELTWEAYNNLDKDQKLAVDFNTLLVEAREKDLAHPWQPADRDDEIEYENKVRKIFGPARGSAIRARNVIEFLDSVGFVAQGQDLDEYLSLDRAVTSSELKDFKLDKQAATQIEKMLDEPVTDFEINLQKLERRNTTPIGGAQRVQNAIEDLADLAPFREARSNENMLRVDTAAIAAAGDFLREQLKKGAIPNWNFEAAMEGVLNPGGLASFGSEQVPLGFGTPEIRGGVDTYESAFDTWMQGMYNKASSPEVDSETFQRELEADMTLKQFTPAERQAWYDYAEQRSIMERDYGQQPTSVLNPRTPSEIRVLLGLEK
jgi:hypothetical protein